MAEDGFRLPISSYEEIVKIILGYGYHDKEASIDDISYNAAIHRTQVSGNNAFLMSIGVIEPTKGGKKITDVGKSLFLALQSGYDEQISHNWSKIVKNTDFLQKILAAIRIRQGMDRSTLITHIAYTAGQRKNKNVIAGSNAIIEIMKNAKLVVEKEDKIIPLKDEADSHEVDGQKEEQHIGLGMSGQSGVSAVNPIITKAIIPSLENGPVNFNFKFNITCTAKEFIELAPELKRTLKELSDYFSVDENVTD